ncbi:type II toxin-antitoxin system HicB family antitoxin [Desulfolutivibrio sulfoxidireducens]|uniref:type II toxin-antitoxin system HicB family antitoxin n=1 Tax=Desulfolutivibrio sulfoxidireducens TaxID=2773299 RepID=UPI00159E4F44|nr:type II toxin-antitoxin system HicB family antitoxin [Desulfolutivibrio sulfoxidireducens]QLA15825.1 type II toxin-antitoxin system HicB family antitoxin [Desulfolutivibrio sulfoxidireducens]
MRLTMEYEEETDGRWLAEIMELPGVMAYGPTQAAAMARVKALALRVIAERLEQGEHVPGVDTISFAAA